MREGGGVHYEGRDRVGVKEAEKEKHRQLWFHQVVH